MEKKIAVIGVGFAGLSAAYHLQKQQVNVTLFEKEKTVGGMASGFRQNNWDWDLESHYHHFFVNDNEGEKLMEAVEQEFLILDPETAIFKNGKIYRFDSAVSFLTFPLLNFLEKIRTGIVLLYLKLSPFPLISPLSFFERQTAFSFLEKLLGKHTFEILFKPLFVGKFGSEADKISAVWFWARIKKRTQKLIYPTRGYQSFADKLAQIIVAHGGKIHFNAHVKKIERKNSMWSIKTEDQEFLFDKIILTVSSPSMSRFFPSGFSAHLASFFSTPYLDSLSLILETKVPVLQKTYWLNINENHFPFLAVIQHTNFINRKHYGGGHICYLGNYLPKNHEYFDFPKEKLLELFWPYLLQINPKLSKDDVVAVYKIRGHDAQPMMKVGYKNFLPPSDLSKLDANLSGLYLANMGQVYPWDRGVNYAIELGRQVAQEITSLK